MNTGIQTAAYLVSMIFFINSLSSLSKQETAKRGNYFGVAGMGIAVLATLLGTATSGLPYILIAFLIASVIGVFLALKVEMTQMPQLVALLHSFVGLAAILVGIGSYLHPDGTMTSTEHTIHMVEVFVGVFVGAITLTGSIVAFGKLQGSLSGNPLLFPGRHVVNILNVLVCIYLGYLFLQAPGTEGLTALIAMTVLSSILGILLVMSIGGADMPVVVSMLNSYSGWAASAAGFMLSNDLLIVTGALVGSSGAILSYIMCKAMNRSFFSVIFGGFGTESATPKAAGAEVQGETVAITVDEVANLMLAARNVVIVPGYGMAVAKAQHPIFEMTKKLRDKGVNVRFAIHPVAGRLPGHMNVLLAEANVPYDIVLEMDEINEDLPETDIVLVVGANDIVNPGAQDDPSSPIYGMPVIEAWKAQTVVVLKRSMASGYAGVENPLFFKENARMLFGDAKKSIDALVQKI